MPVLRPLNSDETNLFVIRCSFKWASTPTSDIIIADQTTESNNLYLECPSFNNLPINFKVTFVSSTNSFAIEYGKNFTSHPTVSATARVLTASTDDSTDTFIPIISKKDIFSVIQGITDCTLCFKNESGVSTTPVYGFDLLIVGSVLLGLTSGNSNKGLNLVGGNEPDSIYTYMNLGINTGNPRANLEINGTVSYKDNILSKTSSFNPLDYETGTTYLLSPSASAIIINLPTPDSGLRYKFLVKTTNYVTITIYGTSDGSSSSSILFGNFIVNGTSLLYNTNPSDKSVLVLGANNNNHTIGDFIECVCDGTNWYFNGIIQVSNSLVMS